MSQITYHPRIPTSRKIVPSKYQRMRKQRWLIVHFSIEVDSLMESMQRAADSMGRLMGEAAGGK